MMQETQNLKSIHTELLSIVNNHSEDFWNISTYLFENPELSGVEYQSADFLCKLLAEKGFFIERLYMDLPTAFKATFHVDDTLPTVAFLAEYDALPGYGPAGNTKAAHACGHNWIAANACGAAITLSSLQRRLPFNVVVMGTPAEETTGGKVDMIRLGAFEGIDLIMQIHPEATSMLYPGGLAMDAIEFNFKGKAAHAAQYPHRGINALDAVQLTHAGINALRQHVTPDVRIHGIVTNGGEAPNIVPALGTSRFYVRANERETVDAITKRVIDCARGAALMTGCTLEHRFFENPADNLVLHETLQQTLLKNMTIAGIDHVDLEPEAMPGSSDIGNVSYIIPTVYANVQVSEGPSVHEPEFLDAIISPLSQLQLKRTIWSMAATSYQIIENALHDTCKMPSRSL